MSALFAVDIRIVGVGRGNLTLVELLPTKVEDIVRYNRLLAKDGVCLAQRFAFEPGRIEEWLPSEWADDPEVVEHITDGEAGDIITRQLDQWVYEQMVGVSYD